MLLAAGGCKSNGEQRDRYTAAQSDIDAKFAAGSGRAPTARTLYTLAGVLAGQGKDAEAHFVLARLIQTYPRFVPAYGDLAELHLRHDRPEEAKAALAAGLAVKPDDPMLLNNLGLCHLTEGDYPGALEHFESAAALVPHNARYQANRALALGMMGEYERSLEAYQSVLPPAEAHHNLAVICEALRDHERAAHEHAQAAAMGFEPQTD